MPPIRLISFGFLHLDGAAPPTADRVEDVRDRLRDPAAVRDILDLDGRDPRVQQVVINTPGARELLANLADYAELPAGPRTIAIGCAGGRHRAAALVELLAQTLCERGHGEVEVEVEHRHVDLPRVLKNPEPGSGPDPILELFDLDNLRRAYRDQDNTGTRTARRRFAMRAASATDLARMAQIEFANRFAPHEALIPPRLAWVGYSAVDPLREAPHAVAYLGAPGFPGQGLFLTYRRRLEPELGTWLADFELVDSTNPQTAWPALDLEELTDTIAGVLNSYEAWCQEGADTARPYDDSDPYAYSDPRDLD